MSKVEDKEPLSQKIIDLVRKNDSDKEITQYIENELENRFMIGFGPEDANSVVYSFFQDQEIGHINIRDLTDFLRETAKDKELLIDFSICEGCRDLLLLEKPYEFCPNCKQNPHNICRRFGFKRNAQKIYMEYAKNIAETVYKKTLKKKLDNRVSGQSDLDVFKEICKHIYEQHRIRFKVFPHSEGGNSSWLYTDILSDLYLNFKAIHLSEKHLTIDTDGLLYSDLGEFWVDNWKDTVHLLKAFNEKIDLSIGNLYPMSSKEVFDQNVRCCIKMDWSERSRNIPKKKFLYSMPYWIIYFYFPMRNLFFKFFTRPKYFLKEFYYDLLFRIEERFK